MKTFVPCAVQFTRSTFRGMFVLSVVFFLSVHAAEAATRTWDGGGADTNWSTAENWSGDAVPGSGDDVVLDGTSTKDSVWDTGGPGTVLSFTLASAYTGKLTMQKASIITSSWSYAGTGAPERFDAGTSTINMSGNVSWVPGNAKYYNFSWGTGGSSSLATTGTATILNNLNVSGVGGGGCLEGGAFNVSGNMTGDNLAACNGTNSAINIVGAGTQTMTAVTMWGVGDVTVNKPSGVLNLVGPITVLGGAWTYTKGRINAGSSTLVFQGNSTFAGGSTEQYNNVAFSSSGSSTQAVTGTVNVTNLEFAGIHGTQVNSGTINVKGNLTTTAAGDGDVGSTNIVLNGLSDQSVTSTSGFLPGGSLTINKTAGTTSFSGTLYLRGGAFTRTAGKINAGTSVISFAGGGTTFTPGSDVIYYDINGGNVTLAGNLNVSHTLTVDGGTLAASGYTIDTVNFTQTAGTFTGSTSVMKVSGNFTHSGGTFTADTSTVWLDGTSQTITGATTFYNLSKFVTAADTLTFTHTTSYTIGSGGTARFMGKRGALLSLQSSSAGTAFTLTKTGNIVAEYVSLKDSTVSSATSAVASTDVSGNTNWTFTREFISTIRATGGDYTTLTAWEAAVQCDLTAATTKVFTHGGITGTIADNTAVTGATSGATGTAVHATATQILIKSISGTFQSGEQIRVDVSNYVTSSDTGYSPIAVAEGYNDWPTSLNDSVTIAGWTTDADNFVMVVIPESQSHRGKLKDDVSSYYRGFTLNPSAQVVPFTTSQDYTRVIGLATDGAGGFLNKNVVISGTDSTLDKILSADASDSGIFVSSNTKVLNSISYGSSSGGAAAGIAFDFPTSGALCYNNTAYGNDRGITNYSTGNNLTVKNTLSAANTGADFYSGADTMTISYSASSDSTSDNFSGTTGDRVSQTFTFVSTANDDYHLAKTDAGAEAYGTDLSIDATYPITNDIDGDARPGRNANNLADIPWDIGADEMNPQYGVMKDGVRLKDGVRVK